MVRNSIISMDFQWGARHGWALGDAIALPTKMYSCNVHTVTMDDQ